MSVDAENGLLYVNTYSPWLDRTTSDRRWNNPVPEHIQIEGFHGKNAENYVLELDLGSHTTPTLAAQSMTFTAGEPVLVGSQELVGSGTVEATATGIELGVDYHYFVELTDPAGNTTRSLVGQFRVSLEVPVEEPSASPSSKPSEVPSSKPSEVPSGKPSVVPSASPTIIPSDPPRGGDGAGGSGDRPRPGLPSTGETAEAALGALVILGLVVALAARSLREQRS